MTPLRKWEVICTPMQGRAIKHVTLTAREIRRGL